MGKVNNKDTQPLLRPGLYCKPAQNGCVQANGIFYRLPLQTYVLIEVDYNSAGETLVWQSDLTASRILRLRPMPEAEV